MTTNELAIRMLAHRLWLSFAVTNRIQSTPFRDIARLLTNLPVYMRREGQLYDMTDCISCFGGLLFSVAGNAPGYHSQDPGSIPSTYNNRSISILRERHITYHPSGPFHSTTQPSISCKRRTLDKSQYLAEFHSRRPQTETTSYPTTVLSLYPGVASLVSQKGGL